MFQFFCCCCCYSKFVFFCYLSILIWKQNKKIKSNQIPKRVCTIWIMKKIFSFLDRFQNWQFENNDSHNNQPISQIVNKNWLTDETLFVKSKNTKKFLNEQKVWKIISIKQSKQSTLDSFEKNTHINYSICVTSSGGHRQVICTKNLTNKFITIHLWLFH